MFVAKVLSAKIVVMVLDHNDEIPDTVGRDFFILFLMATKSASW